MKIQFKTMGIATALFTLFMFTSPSAKAQCGTTYTIKNNLASCSIIVEYAIDDSGTICNKLSGISLSAGASVTILCGACTSFTDIYVGVLQIGAISMGITTDIGASPRPLPPNQCGATTLTQSGTSFEIN